MAEFHGRLQDQDGNLVTRPRVYVYLTGTSTAATIYESDLTTSMENPFTGDDDGSWQFFVPPGDVYYDVHFYKDGNYVSKLTKIAGPTLEMAVTPFNYGGVGDGATDDTTALAAAAAAVPSGGVLDLSGGSWVLSNTLTLAVPMTVFGWGGTLVTKLPIDSIQTAINVTADGVTIQGLTIDNSQAPAGTLTQRHIYVLVSGYDDFRLLDCNLLNLSRKGAHDTSSPGDDSLKSEIGVYLINVNRAWVERCKMTEVSNCCVFIDKARDIWVRKNYFQSLTTSDSFYQIHVETDTQRVWIEDNYIFGGRRAGPAIDIMCQTAATPADPAAHIYIRRNVVSGTEGIGSGVQTIRMNSTDSGEIVGNVVTGIPSTTSTEQTMILVGSRSVVSFPDQPGSTGITVANNVLRCGGALQRGIDVRSTDASGRRGDNVRVVNNHILPDVGGTLFFAAGIRVKDLQYASIEGNTIHYKRDASFTGSIGIDAVESSTVPGGVGNLRIRGNLVEGYSVASSTGISVTGTVASPKVDDNTLNNLATALLFDGSVSDPSFHGNRMTSCTTSVSNSATGVTTRFGNILTYGAARSGTWTITVGNPSVTVSTTEARTGDRIFLTVTTDAATDLPVKVSAIVNATSFTVKTYNGANVAGANLSGTWHIEH